MKVLNIIEEHLVSVGMQNVLEEHFEDVEIITSFEEQDIIKKVKDHTFNLIICDLGIVSLKPTKVMRALTHYQNQANILLFSNAEYKQYAVRYICKGASGFLEKSATASELIMAIKLIMSGQLYISKEMISAIYNSTPDNGQKNSLLGKLSKREHEVFKLLTQGKRIKDISESMEIHQSTASTLKKRILAKFKVNNIIDLKTLAMEYGY
jgi:DNA-binding NarL/FixJ family response regulator